MKLSLIVCAAHAESSPDRVAYRFLRENAEGETLTFGQLDRRVRCLATRFRRHADLGDRALLLYPPGLEFIEAFLGCLTAGIIAVPAYPPRRNRKAERLRTIIDDAQPRLILTSREVATTVEEVLSHSDHEMVFLATDDVETCEGQSYEPSPVGWNQPAFIQYTSGSTGTPRGVMVSHANICSNMEMVRLGFGYSTESIMVCWLPVFHDMGLFSGILQPLFVGFPSILLSPVAFLQEPVRWLRAVSEHRGTTTGGPNFALDHCVRVITEDQKQGIDLTCLSVLYNGAEPIRAETLDRFAAAFAVCGFDRKAFFPCYGLAESTIYVTGGPPGHPPTCLDIDREFLEYRKLTPPGPDSSIASSTLVSSGRPAPGVQLVIVDPDTCKECLPDEVGEIWLASRSVCQGYWERPDESRATFEAGLENKSPFLRTGDLGFIRDGELFVTGRLKDLIIIRGRNIYPQDVEAAISRAIPFAGANSVRRICRRGAWPGAVRRRNRSRPGAGEDSKRRKQRQRECGCDDSRIGRTHQQGAADDRHRIRGVRSRNSFRAAGFVPPHVQWKSSEADLPRWFAEWNTRRRSCLAGVA